MASAAVLKGWSVGKYGGDASTLTNEIDDAVLALGWTPSPPASVFTEAEVRDAMQRAVDIAGGPLVPAETLTSILNRIRGGR